MRMGILIVVHTFGADMKWHPHIHLIVTGGGLSLDGKGQAFVWECHDCHVGVVIPGTYKNIHGEIVKIDPKTLDPDTEVMRF
ncbi:MAG: transposase [Deltaproteobacteria bacterium]|nr:transposase [Deltaproteobacteria bacterium]